MPRQVFQPFAQAQRRSSASDLLGQNSYWLSAVVTLAYKPRAKSYHP